MEITPFEQDDAKGEILGAARTGPVAFVNW